MNQIIQLIVIIALVTGLAVLTRGQMDLHERLASLDTRIAGVDARLAEAAGVQVVYRETGARKQTTQPPPAANETPADVQTVDDVRHDEAAEPPPTPALAANLTERGYMYASDWDDMETELSAMTETENRQFWTHMFEAIESGALEVYDE